MGRWAEKGRLKTCVTVLVFASPIKQTFANNVKRKKIKESTPEKASTVGELWCPEDLQI